MQYLFPFDLIPKGSKIILYGAETVGYEFYRQVVTSDYCHVVKWVDLQYLWYRRMNLPVDSPDDIKNVVFDYVVVTAREEKTYTEISKFLLEHGISKDVVVWRNDYKLAPNFVAIYDEDRVRREAKSAKLVDPADCFSDNRMDVVIRVIYAKAYYAGRLSDFEISLYKRVIQAANKFNEPIDDIIVGYFSDFKCKTGEKDFFKSFHQLLQSIKLNGFYRDKFLPLDDKGELCNGAHRCAAAIALGIKAWAYEYDFRGLPYPYTAEWLSKNGFEENEVKFVYEEYKRIKNM